MASSGSIWVSLGLKTDQFTKGISKAKGSLNGFQKFSAGLKNMFNPLTIGIGVVAGLGAAITNAVGIVNDFEKANSKLAAILGEQGTAGAMKLMSDQAKQLGASTAFTAGEVSGLQTELAKLGFDVSEIEAMTGAVLDLAAASGTELAEAAANTGAIINAFGLESGEAAHVADVMAASFASSALDMEKFSETMKNAAPIARATGVSLETATAAAGKLADANISGSKAGTDLKRIFSELVKDGKPFADSLNDIAGELNGASTKAEKLAIAENLVGERAKGALLILADQKDELGLLAGELGNADGAAKAMADTMLDNVAGSMTKANSAYEGFVLSLEDGNGVISEAAQGVIDLGTSYIQFLTALNNAESGLNGFLELTESAAAITGGMSQEQAKFTKNIGQNAANMGVLNKMLEKGTITQEQYNSAVRKLGEGWKPANKEMQEAATKTMPAVIEETKKLTAAQQKNADELAKRSKDNFGSLDLVEKKMLSLNEVSSGLIMPPVTMDIIVPTEALTTSLAEASAIIDNLITEQTLAEFQSAQDLAMGVGNGIQEAFGGIGASVAASMGEAKNGMDAFKQQMVQFAIDLIAQALSVSISNAIIGATAAGAAAGPAAPFVTPGLIASSIGTVFGAFAAIPAFAEGVTNFGGGTALVGELGPELVNLPRGSDVIPNNKLGGMGGDGMGGEVVFRIEGRELVGILKREGKNSKFSN